MEHAVYIVHAPCNINNALWQSFNGRCDIQNFELIRVQIFQIDFPLIISASKYFRQISLSFYICRGQNEQPAISISQ